MSKRVFRIICLGTSTIALIWAGTNIGQKSLHAAVKKPVPAPTWGAQIPTYGNLAGMSDAHIYRSDDPNVRVTLQKSTTAGVVTSSTMHFFIYSSANPPETWARFNGVNLTDYNIAADPGPAGACGFPPSFNCCALPDCFINFFNSDHPQHGYDHLLFYVAIGADIEDLNTFPMGVDTYWAGPADVTVFIWNSFGSLSADDPEPYESAQAKFKNTDGTNPSGFWIMRVDANTWELRIEPLLFTMSQYYSWGSTVIGKNSKPATVITNYVPLTGHGMLSYKIRLIKNPS